jgi:predicted nucleic acid-binding protein
MFLLDTNVLSELRREDRADVHVAAWARTVDHLQIYLSAITILEIEAGILLLARRDAQQGRVLRTWIDGRVLPAFDGRILAVDTAVAQRCAQLHVPERRAERDALIAATALVHRLKVVTRNVADFKPMGLDPINPWEPASPASPAT